MAQEGSFIRSTERHANNTVSTGAIKQFTMSSKVSSSAPRQAAPSCGVLSIPARARLSRELERLRNDPPPGIAAFPVTEGDLSQWRAEINGPPDGPFEKGIWCISIKFPSRYPMEPPLCLFTSRPAPYHPNIDAEGRICLDTLKSAPAGSWSPAVSLASLLLSLQTLLGNPNPDDGLVAEISQLYQVHPEKWWKEAKRQTQLMLENSYLSVATKAKRFLEETQTIESIGKKTETTPDRKRLKESTTTWIQDNVS